MAKFSFEIEDELPEGYLVLEAVISLKCLDPEGNPTYMYRATPGLMIPEALGMSRVTAAILEKQMVDNFTACGED